jgi:eukaryotic-like serine/threonine-protein kinase
LTRPHDAGQPSISPNPDLPTVPSALRHALAERYRLERELGRGGMAVVYLAQDLKHHRSVAVKVLRRELASTVGSERFLREIAIAATLQHPNILTLIDSGEARDPATGERFVYYVMPFVRGASLRDRLDQGGRMSPDEVLPLVREITDAVASAHRLGIVHRDLKPDNVLLAEGHALIVDFGIAKAMGEARLTETGLSIGTPAYMAPEQATGQDAVDQRADLYAIGVMTYEMLAGVPPFTGSARAVIAGHVTTPPKPLPGGEAAIPPALERLVMRCLEKEPAARYQRAEDLLAVIDAIGATAPVPSSGRRVILGAGAAAVAVLALLAWFGLRFRREAWVHGRALPELVRLVDRGDLDSAYSVANEAERLVPGDSLLESLWPRFSRRLAFVTDPPGATVSRARFDDTTHWQAIGVTPLDSVRVPATVDRYRIEKPGFRPVLLLTGGIDDIMSPPLPARFHLDSIGGSDSTMVRIPGGRLSGEMPDLSGVRSVTLGDFLIGRHEVTNREYQRFVDAGGYTRPELWTDPFVKDGRPIPWADGIRLLVDRTGRPGPATWEAGAVPRGHEDLPVGGVSWYEARAYARFVGQALPTLYQWVRAAGISAAAYLTPSSNFDGQGPRPVGSGQGMGPWGTFDMAGNVREWCVNADGEGKRYILGGGWNDSPYFFTDAYAQGTFDRSVTNGLRLVSLLQTESALAAAAAPIVRTQRDYRKEKPVGDPVYATYRQLYDFDPSPLGARLQSRDTTERDWIRERVDIAAAYGSDRMAITLYLPRRARPPYQTLVFFPHGGAIHSRRFDDADARSFDFLIKSGRAFAYPTYLSTFERGDGLADDTPDSTVAYRDHVLAWGKDLRRAVDYLVTRPDVDSTRLGYVGVSFGGRMGGIMLAIEPRFKVGILEVAGLKMAPMRPEVDPLNFLPRVRAAVLMLNGKYDHLFPIETSQAPFYDLLGTPPDRKKWVVDEGGHFVSRTLLISASLAWLDRFLGPVASGGAADR